MELGLIGIIDGSFYRKGQLRVNGKLGVDSGFHGCFGFLPENMSILKRIQAGRAFLKIAEDGAGSDQALVFQNGFLVGRGVKPCMADTHVFLDFLVDKSVLGCDLGGGAFGLAAADSVCLQDDDLLPGLGEVVGGQDSGQTGADDSHVCGQTAWKVVAGRDGCGLGPDGFWRCFQCCSPQNSTVYVQCCSRMCLLKGFYT